MGGERRNCSISSGFVAVANAVAVAVSCSCSCGGGSGGSNYDGGDGY